MVSTKWRDPQRPGFVVIRAGEPNPVFRGSEEIFRVIHDAILDDETDVARRGDVFQRIAVRDVKIRQLARLDGAKPVIHAQGAGTIDRSRLQDRDQRHACPDHGQQLSVIREAGKQQVVDRLIGTHQDEGAAAGLVEGFEFDNALRKVRRLTSLISGISSYTLL